MNTEYQGLENTNYMTDLLLLRKTKNKSVDSKWVSHKCRIFDLLYSSVDKGELALLMITGIFL